MYVQIWYVQNREVLRNYKICRFLIDAYKDGGSAELALAYLCGVFIISMFVALYFENTLVT